MGIFTKIFGSKAAKSVEAFALTETQKAVAALKQTAIGATVAADIKALTDHNLTGTQKFETVVATTAPLIVGLLGDGGVKKAVADVEDLARALVQEIYNDALSTKAGSVANSILKLLHLK